jgi:prevent-host-death family protein
MSLLTPINCCSEDVLVKPVVIPELELSNIERQIFAAHFVERANHAALEDRPEAFDDLGMNRTDDVLAVDMINGRVRIFLFSASEAKTHLSQRLEAVELGETIVITRHGRAIARLIPRAGQRRAEIKSVIEDIESLRRSMPKSSPSEIQSLIGEGRKY